MSTITLEQLTFNIITTVTKVSNDTVTSAINIADLVPNGGIIF